MPAWVDPYANQTINLIQARANAQAEAQRQIAQYQAQAAQTTAQAQAQAQLQGGQAWGQAIGQLGQLPTQIMQAQNLQSQIDDRKQQAIARQQQNAEVAARQAGEAKLDVAMQGDQLPAGDAGPRAQSYVGQDGLFDLPKLNQMLASSGSAHLAPELLKGAEQINDSVTKHQELQQKLATQNALMLGDQADGALTLSKTLGIDIPSAMDISVQPALLTGRYTADQYAQVRQKIAALPPDQQAAALNAMRDAAAKLDKGETLSKDAEHVDRYGRVITSNVVPEKPTEASIAMDAAHGDPAKAMSLLKPPPKQSIEEEWLARDRRLAVAKNGGQPLTDAQQKAVDAASMQTYAASKADPAVRDAALAQKAVSTALANLQLGMMPTKEDTAALADDLVQHRMAPSQVTAMLAARGTIGLALRVAVRNEALKQDPDFNWEEAQSSYDLAKSPSFQNQVRFMDSTVESIPRLLQNVNKLGRGNFRSLNELENATADQFNATDLKRVKTDALLVSDEVAKVLTGGGTGSVTSDAKLKQASDLINTSDSVPAIASALDEIQTLMGNRRRALTRGTYMEGSAPGAGASGSRGRADQNTLVPSGQGPDLTGLTPGHGRTFSSGPYAGQTWTTGSDGKPQKVGG